LNYILMLGFAAFASTVVTAAVSAHLTKRLHQKSWEELLDMIEPVNIAAIHALAHEHLHPSKGQLSIEPYEIWRCIGGKQGLKMMRRNIEVMCALAAYAERWNFDEAVIVTERIRREAATVRRAINRVNRYNFIRPARRQAPFYLVEAATAYHLMRERLLALYQSSHAGLYPHLAATL
jgi:hypothetical protein